MKKLEQLYEGKAKKVFATDDPNVVLVDYKDDATAFNGLKKGTIMGKGVINNRVTNFLMKMLEKNGIPTHYIEEISDRETLVKKVEIVPLEGSAVLTGVGAGKYDRAVAGMAYTPERAETMAMSKVYKPGGDQGLLVPADKVDEYTSLADFAGKKVGFQSGTVQEQNVLTQLPDSEPVTFDIIQNAVLALDSGKVDAVSVSIANGEMFVSTNPKLAVSTVQFDNSQNGNVIGFPKGETELVDAVNKIIDEVLEQGLYDQWLEEATAEAENLGL